MDLFSMTTCVFDIQDLNAYEHLRSVANSITIEKWHFTNIQNLDYEQDTFFNSCELL